jgi:aryl-alcohol dehydrogenase-like predicted oxidoreductase
MLSKPAVTAPIVGITKLNHLDAPLAAVENPLSVEEIGALEAPYVSQAVIGPLLRKDARLPEGRPRKAD